MIVMSKTLPALKLPLGFNILASRCDPTILNRMFQSIDPIADQLVVVIDEGAGPLIYQIARQYTDDIFYHFGTSGDFAGGRNVGLDHTYTDYIAWLDTDEWIEPFNVGRYSNLMRKPGGLAYYVWQVSPTRENVTIWVPQVRIFPNVPGLRWEIPIHEQILPSLDRAGIKTQLTDLRVFHAGYWNKETVYRKHRRNLKILKREVKRNPGDWFTRSNYDKAMNYERWLKQQRRAAA